MKCVRKGCIDDADFDETPIQFLQKVSSLMCEYVVLGVRRKV